MSPGRRGPSLGFRECWAPRLYLPRSSVHETPEDIRALQELLDRSYEAAGAHLRSINTPERRVTAEDLVGQLTGMCLLVVATVTADCRPIAGPLDGIFYRGAF